MLEFTVISTGEKSGSWWDELSPELQERLEKELAERQTRKIAPTFSLWLPPIKRPPFPLDERSFGSPH